MKTKNELFGIGKDKSKVMLTALFAVGALLLSLPVFFDTENKGTENDTHSELFEYTEHIEKGLSESVGKLVGDTNVSVMVTLESTYENVYVSNASINEAVTADKTDKKSEKQLVLTGTSSSGQTPVVVKMLPPKVRGAVIVCKMGDDAVMREKIRSLAATALDISETKIYVTGGN